MQGETMLAVLLVKRFSNEKWKTSSPVFEILGERGFCLKGVWNELTVNSPKRSSVSYWYYQR